MELVALRAALTVRQMLPEAFVVNFIFFGMQTKPAPPSPSIALFATRCGCVEAVLRSVRRVMPVVGRAVDLFALLALLFYAHSQVCLDTRGMSSDGRRIILRWSAPQKLGGRVVKIGAIGARRAGYAKREGLRNAPGYPGLRLAQLHSFAAEH